MGFFSDYQKAKKQAEEEFKRKHPILSMLADNGNNSKNNRVNKKNNLEKRMNILGLDDEERKIVRDEGYDPEDFEYEDLEDDDYYFDEKGNE